MQFIKYTQINKKYLDVVKHKKAAYLPLRLLKITVLNMSKNQNITNIQKLHD